MTQTILGGTNTLGIDGYVTGNTGTFANLYVNNTSFNNPPIIFADVDTSGSQVPFLNRIQYGTSSSNGTTYVNGVGVDRANGSVAYFCGKEHIFHYNSTSTLVGANATMSFGDTGQNTGLYVDGDAGGTSPWSPASDYRIKQYVQNLDDLYVVDNLRPVSYYNTLSNKKDVGLIAHELQEIYPFMVNGEKDGPKNQSVGYTSLIGILIKEIQRLKERVSILENK